MIEAVKTPFPAIEGFCGPKMKTYVLQILPSQIFTLLGHNPSEPWEKLEDSNIKRIYEEIQRKTTTARRNALAQYMQERMSSSATLVGGFPPICIGMLNSQEFEPLKQGMGFLKIDTSKPDNCVLFDGLGRVTGIHHLIKVLKGNPNSLFTLAVMIFVPTEGEDLDMAEVGQMFHDFNLLTLPVTARHALALDQCSSLYATLAEELARKPVIASQGGMEKRSASIGKNSTALVVQQVFMRFVRGACEGARFQEANLARVEQPNLTDETYTQVLANLNNYLEEISKWMGPRFKEKDSILLTSPGWQALGLIYHDFAYRLPKGVATPQVYTQITKAIANVDWSRHNPEWIGLLGEAELDKKTGVPIVDNRGRQRVALSRAGRTNRATLYEYLLKHTGLGKLLDQQASVAA